MPAQRTRTRPAAPASVSVRERFRDQDEYRVEREWRRYEGNALRDLFRTLRVRFLERHPAPVPGSVLEIGPGPGRFSPHLGGPEHPRVLIDLSLRALRVARTHLSGRPLAAVGRSEYVRGDARRLPFRPCRFAQCVLLGNSVGFAGREGIPLVESAAALVAPGGSLILEFVAGSGERSRYLRRLPPGAMRRMLASPLPALIPRVDREGFDPSSEPKRRSSGFARYRPPEVLRILERTGFLPEEVLSVAPGLGALPDRIEVVRSDPRAWERYLELEEALGRRPERWEHAAAVLVSARRPPPPMNRIK